MTHRGCHYSRDSDLIGAFGFAGACTSGDGSCDPPTRSMGAGFCNFRVMQWNTDTPLSQPLLQEQRIRESSKVVREEEGLSSNRPELVTLRECLEAHEDSEASLQEEKFPGDTEISGTLT